MNKSTSSPLDTKLKRKGIYMFNISKLRERQKLLKELQPIYYPNSVGNIKLDAIFISEYLLKHLENILPNGNIDLNISECMLFKFIIDLLETSPKFKSRNKTKHTYPIAFDNSANKNKMYYGGAISVSEQYAKNIYKECKFSERDSYMFTVSCIIRLSAEIENPNAFSEFEDVPEHLLATYNIMCYYFKSTGNFDNIENMCIILFLLSKKYLDKIT